jgi:hypothetical protein
MDKKALTAIWTGLSLAAVYYAINTYLVSQGMSTIFGTPVVDVRPIPSALFGLIIVPSILIPSGLVGALHAWRHGSQWHERIPTVFLKKLDTASMEGKVYQVVVLIIVLVVPTVAVLHFWDKINCSDCIFDTNNSGQRCSAQIPSTECHKELPMLKSIWEFQDNSKSDRYRLGVDAGKDFGDKNGGVSFVPGLTPLLLLAMNALSLASNLWFLFLVFHGAIRRGQISHGATTTPLPE